MAVPRRWTRVAIEACQAVGCSVNPHQFADGTVIVPRIFRGRGIPAAEEAGSG
ncbi:hypothetical protein Q5762_11150 [Streptomyces sp. P9(2023)]|uniref:hypothetical protein n=1 Tax=Streptomyces sp. P9(2023) TaxID=3064394 RepID=UPI0028F4075E|nr:hypothetical protein [Streptomyces sp. P9(2023)]MDT9688895.1 hypothetical protein [Streptomyces sp. P9(2023)]